MELKDLLKENLSGEELKLVPTSFDIIGNKQRAVCIIEIPEELKAKEVEIAYAVMKLHKAVKSVLKKASERKGVYRKRGYRLIAGDKNTEVVHKEHGYLLRLDPQKVYFSPREGTERQRIAEQVKPNEIVLVMFSGISPFPIAIAKKQPRIDKVYAVELNRNAHRYAKENVRINRLSDKIILMPGDVREECKKLYGSCDRVVMPLPLGAENFLDIAINCLKPKGGIINFYSWGSEGDLFSNTLKLIQESTKNLNRRFEILEKRKVLPYKPRNFKICVDFRVK